MPRGRVGHDLGAHDLVVGERRSHGDACGIQTQHPDRDWRGWIDERGIGELKQRDAGGYFTDGRDGWKLRLPGRRYAEKRSNETRKSNNLPRASAEARESKGLPRASAEARESKGLRASYPADLMLTTPPS